MKKNNLKALALCMLLFAGCTKDVQKTQKLDAVNQSDLIRKPDTTFATKEAAYAFSNLLSSSGKIISVSIGTQKVPNLVQRNLYQGGATFDVTFWFDEPFPFPNYYVTITYSISGGSVTSANITTSTWGAGMYGSYSQNYGSTGIYHNTITFNASGSTTTGIGFGSYVLQNTEILQFQGWVQINVNGTVSGGIGQLTPKAK